MLVFQYTTTHLCSVGCLVYTLAINDDIRKPIKFIQYSINLGQFNILNHDGRVYSPAYFEFSSQIFSS